MKKLLTLALALYFSIVPNISLGYTSLGAYSCGNLIKHNADNNQFSEAGTISYFRGYATGRNYELNRNINSDPDNNSIYYAVIKYCKDNPLKNLAQASEYIYSTLD